MPSVTRHTAVGILAAISIGLTLDAGASGRAQDGPVRLVDGFDAGLEQWTVIGAPAVRIIESGDPGHGPVMLLEPNGDVLARVRGSERWGSLRLEGEALFPADIDNYLGVAYNVQRRGERLDYGLIYIKGNDSYLQANPHRDSNVGRTLYPDFNVPLRDAAAVRTGEWIRFSVEVDGSMCHFYVGDMETPQMTFPLFELSSGQVGLQPRSVGGPVWVDNIRVTSIGRLSYQGPPRPAEPRRPDAAMLTSWQVLGPLNRTHDEAAREPEAAGLDWRPFETDARGAVVTGRVVDYHGSETTAYFRTQVSSAGAREATLHLSTVDDLAIWVNGRFHWFVARGSRAWPDFGVNPEHAGQRIPIRLQAGANDIVIRVRGGVYASGGFFARLEDGTPR